MCDDIVRIGYLSTSQLFCLLFIYAVHNLTIFKSPPTGHIIGRIGRNCAGEPVSNGISRPLQCCLESLLL